MKQSKIYTWSRLLRTMVALLVAMSVLLCGCVQTDDGTQGSSTVETQGPTDPILGDGDGKLEPQDAVDGLTALYGALVNAFGSTASANYGYGLDLQLTLGQDLLSQLGAAMEQLELESDMSWFQSIGLSLVAKTNGDLSQIGLSALVNDQNVVSLDGVLDAAGGMCYVGSPELNSQYISLDILGSLSEDTLGSIGMLEQYSTLLKELPTEQALNALLTRYLKLALETLTPPTTAETQLSAGGINKTVTATTYTFSQHNLLDIAALLLTTAKTDTELEAVLDGFGSFYNQVSALEAQQYGETWVDVDLYAQLLEQIDPTLEDIQDARANSDDLIFAQLTVYTEGESQVGGLLSVNNGDVEMLDYITFYALRDGENTAFYGDVMGAAQLSGSGKQVNDQASGSYALTIDGVQMLWLEVKDWDTKALHNGQLKGTLRLRMSDDLLYNMDLEDLLNADSVIELQLDCGDSGAQVGLRVYQGELLLIGLSLSGQPVSADNIQLPTNYISIENEEAMSNWMESMTLSTVLGNLTAAGVPADLVALLQQALEDALGMPLS